MTARVHEFPAALSQIRHDADPALQRVAMDAAPDGIVLVDSRGTMLYANAALAAMSGYSLQELIQAPIHLLLPVEQRHAHKSQIGTYFGCPSRRPMGMGRDLWLQRKDGSKIPVDVALGHSEECGGAAVAFVRDLTELRRLEARMHYQATHDTLTGLLNRWQFGQRLEQAITESARQGEPFALLLLDLDDFKAINDGYGHAAGDQVLIEVARRLKGVMRASDTLARLGGDEFTVLLQPLSGPQEAQERARQVLQVLCQPCRMHGFELNFGASLGIATCPSDATDAPTLMRYADMAMYQAKERGRAHFAFYTDDMGRRMAEKVLLHERLKVALGYGALTLHYQPQVDVATGRICGAEALLRWTDPQLGEVTPDRFIPVAEATGLILALGAWVLDEACRQVAQWSQEGRPLRVAVNLSAQQLRQTDLVEKLAESLQRYGTPAQMLELEVTESEAMADPDQAREVLCSLQALGVGLALDDFGTGYSSLVHLKQLPVTRIKIDREFIRPLQHSAQDATMVRAIIVLARTLGLRVVAEGVETAAQLQFLGEHGCDAYQGWLCSKAVPGAQLQMLRQAEAGLLQ